MAGEKTRTERGGLCGHVVLPVNQAANLRVFGVDGLGSNDVSNCCGVLAADDFTLARMEVKHEKHTRRLAVGKEGFFGGKSSGLDPSAYVPVKVEKVSDGVFHIEPVQTLKHGE